MVLLIVLFLTLGLSFPQEVYRFGFTAVVAKEDVKSVEKFLNYLKEKTGYSFVPVFTKSYDEMSYLLSRGMVDAAYICGAPYVEDKDYAGFELLAVPLYRGKPLYYSYVITRREKGYKSILDFKGKPYAFSDPKSNSGSVVPTYILMRNGYKAERFFKPIVYTYSHSESILAVYYGFVEGASVDSVVFDQFAKKSPEVASQLKVVEKYGPYPITPVVVRSQLSEDVKYALRKALTLMSKNPKGRDILSELSLDGFTVVEDSFYNPIREMITFIKNTSLSLQK
ncbi:phosphonate transport system substrate-binding protein [Hydrogenivirga caldilitoris]|uniref:Phosphonate transport system substrate-binding protein n=1 Tax=Hydrogenivirga caldilitoris TaxID=246264 RepID=A0A497XNM5_9AQUI|nr:phosphate/phosphite/phosphonate ABC transporter substrate-binding protein [Hydrogenivirga caldilitoris]RLJ70547.1 phosphonate transport system substrate-binding protein [Hydrogenivirga caldilitoris]